MGCPTHWHHPRSLFSHQKVTRGNSDHHVISPGVIPIILAIYTGNDLSNLCHFCSTTWRATPETKVVRLSSLYLTTKGRISYNVIGGKILSLTESIETPFSLVCSLSLIVFGLFLADCTPSQRSIPPSRRTDRIENAINFECFACAFDRQHPSGSFHRESGDFIENLFNLLFNLTSRHLILKTKFKLK